MVEENVVCTCYEKDFLISKLSTQVKCFEMTKIYEIYMTNIIF